MKTDLDILNEMQDILDELSSSEVITVSSSSHLLLLRDNLKFEDTSWFKSLTQQIVTLDSAATFTPKNYAHKIAAKNAVIEAVSEISDLLNLKMSAL